MKHQKVLVPLQSFISTSPNIWSAASLTSIGFPNSFPGPTNAACKKQKNLKLVALLKYEEAVSKSKTEGPKRKNKTTKEIKKHNQNENWTDITLIIYSKIIVTCSYDDYKEIYDQVSIYKRLTISSSKSSFNDGPKYGGELPVGWPWPLEEIIF